MAFSLSSKAIMAAVVATMLTGVSIARADFVTYSAVIAPPQVPPTALVPTFTQFDPALGTLTSAAISLNLSLNVAATEFNAFAAPGTPFTATVSNLNFSVTDPYGATTGHLYSFTGDPAYTITGFAGTPGSSQILALSAVAFAVASNVPGANLADYIGTGTVSPSFAQAATLNAGGSGTGQFLGGSTADGGTATITYTFTPTPEPASLSLLGLSGLGLLLRRRQR